MCSTWAVWVTPPVGDCSIDGRTIDVARYPALAMAVRAGVLCNDARLNEDTGVWSVVGDPDRGRLAGAGWQNGLYPGAGRAGLAPA
jgi:hypothetical protein